MAFLRSEKYSTNDIISPSKALPNIANAISYPIFPSEKQHLNTVIKTTAIIVQIKVTIVTHFFAFNLFHPPFLFHTHQSNT